MLTGIVKIDYKDYQEMSQDDFLDLNEAIIQWEAKKNGR